MMSSVSIVVGVGDDDCVVCKSGVKMEVDSGVGWMGLGEVGVGCVVFLDLGVGGV